LEEEKEAKGVGQPIEAVHIIIDPLAVSYEANFPLKVSFLKSIIHYEPWM